MTEPAPFLLILGMHRSGTSCLAGALEQCGLFLGEVRRTGRFNTKGYYELAALTRLHEDILAANRGSWHDPPERAQVTAAQLESLEQLATLYSYHRPCGLKDPRLLLLLDTWVALVAQPAAFVGTFRHPVAVARSLAARNGLSEDCAIRLWLRYNSELARWHQARPFPLIAYDLSTPDEYCRAVTSAAAGNGLSPELSRVREFVDQNLEHQSVPDAPIPASCREVYNYLAAHCVRAPANVPFAQTEAQRSFGARHHVAAEIRSLTNPIHAALNVSARVGRRGLRAVQIVSQNVERRLSRRRAETTNLSDLRSLVIFVGNPRCGTTLVRTMLDTHSRIVIGNEVNLLQRLQAGEDWKTVVGRIVESARRFRRRPEWEGYSYQTGSPTASSATDPVAVVGDKKAGATTRILMENPFLLDQLMEWSPAELRVVHCVRNPFDVIATKTRRNHQGLRWNVDRYFKMEQTASYLHERLGASRMRSVHLEALISSPRRVLKELLAFLDLGANIDYLTRCEALVHGHPNHTRYLQEWPDEAVGEVERRTARCAHLSQYLTSRGFEIAHTEIDTNRTTAHRAF